MGVGKSKKVLLDATQPGNNSQMNVLLDKKIDGALR